MSSSIGVARRVLVMKFASEFILIYPLYTIMFGERGGVNAAGVGTILALGYVFSVLFEIPTGIVADKVVTVRAKEDGLERKVFLYTAPLKKAKVPE